MQCRLGQLYSPPLLLKSEQFSKKFDAVLVAVNRPSMVFEVMGILPKQVDCLFRMVPS